MLKMIYILGDYREVRAPILITVNGIAPAHFIHISNARHPKFKFHGHCFLKTSAPLQNTTIVLTMSLWWKKKSDDDNEGIYYLVEEAAVSLAPNDESPHFLGQKVWPIMTCTSSLVVRQRFVRSRLWTCPCIRCIIIIYDYLLLVAITTSRNRSSSHHHANNNEGKYNNWKNKCIKALPTLAHANGTQSKAAKATTHQRTVLKRHEFQLILLLIVLLQLRTTLANGSGGVHPYHHRRPRRRQKWQ